MSVKGDELERWLAGEDLFDGQYLDADDWVSGFDADRQVVVLKLGPYKRCYLRPEKFTPRFYHQLYPLQIERWPYHRQLVLFNEFCTIDVLLDVRFQATLPYVQRNIELLPALNDHIKQTYADSIDDIVNRELRGLDDGTWVRTGMSAIEKRLTASICELLALQHIQADAFCTLDVKFAEFPAVEPGQNNVYLNVLKKSYEIADEKYKEMSRQERLAEQHRYLEKQAQLEHARQMADLELQQQAQEAERKLRLSEEKRKHMEQQFAVEKEIVADQLKHEALIKEMQFDTALRLQAQENAKQRQTEASQMAALLTHQEHMEDQKITSEILRRQKSRQRLAEAEKIPAANTEEGLPPPSQSAPATDAWLDLSMP